MPHPRTGRETEAFEHGHSFTSSDFTASTYTLQPSLLYPTTLRRLERLELSRSFVIHVPTGVVA